MLNDTDVWPVTCQTCRRITSKEIRSLKHSASIACVQCGRATRFHAYLFSQAIEELRKSIEIATWRKTPAEVRLDMHPALLAELEDHPLGLETALFQVQNASALMVQAIGDEADARTFLDGVDRLPTPVMLAVYREGLLGVPGFVRPADDK